MQTEIYTYRERRRREERQGGRGRRGGGGKRNRRECENENACVAVPAEHSTAAGTEQLEEPDAEVPPPLPPARHQSENTYV